MTVNCGVPTEDERFWTKYIVCVFLEGPRMYVVIEDKWLLQSHNEYNYVTLLC